MIVAGVMSGTSADGIDVALVQISQKPRARAPRLKLRGHAGLPYTPAVRRAVLAAMNSSKASVADLARLNFLLGEHYAEAVLAAQKKLRLKCDLIGCHGQTLYHQGTSAPFLGKKLAVTWQTGEGAVIAARTGVPVVSDFRPADMAAEGKGAPLVPYLDYILFRDQRVGRIALNIGGIANLTAIPPGASPGQVLAFDTGPGNMVIDALAAELMNLQFDRDGRMAARGRVNENVVTRFLQHDFFQEKPPKTAGREEFGREFVREFASACGSRARSIKPEVAADVIATATALTARSIGAAIKRFVLPRSTYADVIASGGGTRNPILMAWLRNELRDLKLELRSSDEFGIPSAAKEAVAFAVLAYETWHRRPSNVAAATGAKRAVVLGKISYP
ncbi:MAG TPA: anhydro-N-acetylmuramic acid kinase [Candidatus Acidoferrales bacterium]|nr:anhydro-N-acetylmuramic acid kinase [Candidatus Acidoferrales bacterium]